MDNCWGSLTTRLQTIKQRHFQASGQWECSRDRMHYGSSPTHLSPMTNPQNHHRRVPSTGQCHHTSCPKALALHQRPHSDNTCGNALAHFDVYPTRDSPRNYGYQQILQIDRSPTAVSGETHILVAWLAALDSSNCAESATQSIRRNSTETDRHLLHWQQA
ncbi:hypothetical protein BCR34DRAFT_661476 [Clohesyomyces aquaticus]|uniref:Uncharacterized protein n=1 Tax=Clohesyomyces aquaticus TaxID=1231657 RepID=A0A1Y2A1P4_9PLEO|nr:hypothetical protein BCR34DRAFT_661476 [Clohesyomyces aquaticus]